MSVYFQNGNSYYAIIPPPKKLETYTLEFETTTTSYATSNIGLAYPNILCLTRVYGDNSGNNKEIYIMNNNGCLATYFAGAGNPRFTSNAIINDNKPHKIVMVVPRMRDTYFYIDGKFVYRYNMDDWTWVEYDNAVYGGNNLNSYLNYCVNVGKTIGNFRIDYLRLTDRVLSPKEFFNKISDKSIYYFPHLQLLYSQNNNVYMKDWSGNGRNIQLVSGTNCKSKHVISNLNMK